MRFIQVLEGADGQSAKPVIASGDAKLVAAVGFLLSRRLGVPNTVQQVGEAFAILDADTGVESGGARQ